MLSFSSAQDAPTVFELAASPVADPDPRDEPSIAVSPTNDQIIVGASKVILGGGGGTGGGDTRISYYYSSDGGHTWGSNLLTLETPQKTWGRASDPSIAADLNGNFYLCALMLDNSNFDTGVYVFKSTDGGRTFADPVPAALDIGSGSNPKQADKCFITVDTSPSSQFKNTIYAIWTSTETNAGTTTAFIRTAHRRPGDAAFSSSKIISHAGDMRGPSIATGPDGEFYAAWEGIGNPKVILFNASTDGGETFLPPDVAPSTDLNIHNFVGSLSGPNASLSITGVPRINSFPVIDVDRSNGPNRGMIYVTWAETTNGVSSDVFVMRMTPPNGGRPQMSFPVRANNEGAGDQFFPWLSVDATTGDVEVAFYDRRDDPGGLLINLYVARSTDGGASFGENIKVSGASSDPRVQANVIGSGRNAIGIGDYIAIAATRGKANVMWTDTRRQKQEIFYGQIAYQSSGGTPPASGFDDCQNARVIAAAPFADEADTRAATTAADDPVLCSGVQGTNSVWYTITPSVDTVYGVDTVASDYDTVVSVFTGTCSARTAVVCNDNFGDAVNPANRSMLSFAARAGVTYLIEVSGKGTGGTLRFRLGYPTITAIEYTSGPDGNNALKITGAGFVSDSASVIVQRDGEDTPLPKIFFTGEQQGDGTVTTVFATKKKLKKLVKPGRTVVVRIESPAGSSRVSVPFIFTR